MQFAAIQDVIHVFLEDHLRIIVREIQPTHLGQALVRVVNTHDRDLLVQSSPYHVGDVQLSFDPHNQGRNWCLMNFNRECWLMLLGFPLDHWNHDSIQNDIASFGRVLLWENERSYLARLLIRTRVIGLNDVPYFIVITETEGFQG
jgi:hypothetical protein